VSKTVAIVGAGVVGLVLAKELSKSGIETDVYESKDRVSQGAAKASGIFSVDGLSRIGVDFKRAIVNTLDGATLYAGGEAFSVSAKGTKAYVLDRGVFAELCKEEAEAEGAKIILGKRMDNAGVLKLKDEYSVLAGADGAVSTVASACKFPSVKEYVLTYKAEYDNVDVKDRHKVGLLFSNRIANRFFGWTVPYSSSKMEIGIGISDRNGANSYRAFRQFMKTDYVTDLMKGARSVAGYASLIPISARKKTVIGNVLLVGDAAGQVKATTGGGIIFGVSCAKIAAGCIKRHIENGSALAEYEHGWRSVYGLDLKLHKMLHAYYSTLGERRFKLMMKTAKLFGFEDFLGAYGDMDRPSVMLKRLLFRNLA
jgi:flavin-dependent dehydrogenase